MMTFTETLRALTEMGAEITRDGNDLLVAATVEMLPPDLFAALREHKPAFLHLLSLPAPVEDAPPSEEWDDQTAELVEWYATVRESLPPAPFKLTGWAVVTDTERFRDGLDRVIAEGPSAGRAPLATLRTHLAALRAILTTTARRAA